MVKWADYVITAKRTKDEGGHILAVKVAEDRDEKIGVEKEWLRGLVVTAIEQGKDFVTAFENEDGKYRKGEDVHVVTVNGKKFIRTDKNQTERDNLGELPEF